MRARDLGVLLFFRRGSEDPSSPDRGPRTSSYACAVSALLWWLIPIGATVLAVLYVTYRSRPDKPADAHDGMERLRRMQDAMERPMPQHDPNQDEDGRPL